jgi:hypothetical protein
VRRTTPLARAAQRPFFGTGEENTHPALDEGRQFNFDGAGGALLPVVTHPMLLAKIGTGGFEAGAHTAGGPNDAIAAHHLTAGSVR